MKSTVGWAQVFFADGCCHFGLASAAVRVYEDGNGVSQLSQPDHGKQHEGKFVREIRFLGSALVVGVLTLFGLRATAHTLPISYLFVVTDQDYVHLELSFNPFELANFAEFDTNRNSRLDAGELAAAGPGICRQLLSQLTLSANDKLVAAENAGLSPEGDTHHAVLRAHYRVDARNAKLALESRLPAITSSSHLTQVNFLRKGKRELAQLDVQSRTASFSVPEASQCDPTIPEACANCKSTSGPGAMIAMSVAFGIVMLVALQRSRRPANALPPAAASQPTKVP